MASEPLKAQRRIRLEEDVEFDPNSNELSRAGRVFKLERIPSAVLLFLVERSGQVVGREEIVERVWGKDVFLDTDNAINSAIRKIRQALKDNPDSPRFIQTISGKGYRFIGHSDVGIDPTPRPNLASWPSADVSKQIDRETANASSETKALSERARLFLAVVVLVAIATAVWLLRRGVAMSTAQAPIRSLAVLPLQNLSGDPTQEYLADGMTESIIGRLSAIRELRVISRTSAMRFKNTQLPVPEIARQLGGVDALVEGSVIRDGNRIRVHAQLIRAATDEHFWSEEYDRELKDVLSLQSDVAQSIAKKVQVTLTGPERERLASVSPVPPQVYENYLKGRYALGRVSNRADTEKSITYFQQAIEQDPSFAPAYLGVADAYMALATIYIGAPPEEMRRKAMDAASKALQLDPQSVDAHALLATIYRSQWQWSQAEAELRRTLELNPNNAAAHDGMATWLTCQGRTDEGIAWARRARELDPERAQNLIWILFLSRRYPEAIGELRSVLALQPNDPGALWGLGYNLIANGQPEEAIPPLERALAISNRSPGVIGVLIRAYAHAGRRSDALRLLTELKQRQKNGYVPAGAFINGYLGLGETDEAFAALEQGYKEHSNILEFLKVHPHFDPIRADSRFQDLLRRLNFPQTTQPAEAAGTDR